MAPSHHVRTFRFILRLNASERRRFDAELTRQRQLYNAAHQERQDSYRWACRQASILGRDAPRRALVEAIDPSTLDETRRKIREDLLEWSAPNFFSQGAAMSLKEQTTSLGEVVLDAAAVTTRWTLKRLDDAWVAFFKRCAEGATPGFPRYRSDSRWRSFGCRELADSAFLRPEAEGLGFHALGFLKIPNVKQPVAVRMHRMLPAGAEVVACTFTRRGTRWEVGLQCRLPVTHGCETGEQLRDVTEGEILAFDAGIATQAMDDHGNAYGNARHADRLSARVRRAQRGVARARKGSGNAKRKKARVASLRRKEADGRSTASRRNAALFVGEAIATNMRVIAHEDLAIRNMMRSAAGTAEKPGTRVAQKRALTRGLADAALGWFTDDVRCKAERAGIACVAVDPRRTSQECWCCGTLVPKTLGEREHSCPSCGFVAHRDVNAAMVIRRRAATLLTQTAAKRNNRPEGRRGGRAPRVREASTDARPRRVESEAA